MCEIFQLGSAQCTKFAFVNASRLDLARGAHHIILSWRKEETLHGIVCKRLLAICPSQGEKETHYERASVITNLLTFDFSCRRTAFILEIPHCAYVLNITMAE